MDISSKRIAVQDIATTTGGNLTINTGTFTIGSGVAADDYKVYRLTGAQTLASDLDVVASGTLLKNLYVEVWNESVLTLSGNKLTILGKDVPTVYAGKRFIAKCLCNGVNWNVTFVPSSDQSGYIFEEALASDSVTSAKIVNDNITTIKILDQNVTTAKIADGGVTAVKIADANVTTAKILDANVTTAKIADANVTTIKILDANVTTAKIADSNVTTAKVANAAITPTKMSANANKYTRDIRLSFAAAAEVGNITFTICEDCAIDEINVTVLSPATDDTATLVFKDNGGTVLTGSQVDVTTSLTLGNIVSTTPTANNVFSAGDNFLIEMSKTTKTSCKVNVSICITKV